MAQRERNAEYPDEDLTRDFATAVPSPDDCIVCGRHADRIDPQKQHPETYWNWCDLSFHSGVLCSSACLAKFEDVELRTSDTYCTDRPIATTQYI
jgi:hypothetical protein